MQNTLIVLSELAASHFDLHNGAIAAMALKQRGTTRADITLDPRFRFPESHGVYTRPVSDFDKAAGSLARTIFEPVLGQSTVVDLTHATTRQKRLPDIASLSTVGRLFASRILGPDAHNMSTRDGMDIGLSFFLALHGTTPKGKPYDALVHAALSDAVMKALETLSPAILDEPLNAYGTTVNLGALRRALNRVQAANVISRHFQQHLH